MGGGGREIGDWRALVGEGTTAISIAGIILYNSLLGSLILFCGLQKNVNSLMKSTSSVKQMVVYKPEWTSGVCFQRAEIIAVLQLSSNYKIFGR